MKLSLPPPLCQAGGGQLPGGPPRVWLRLWVSVHALKIIRRGNCVGKLPGLCKKKATGSPRRKLPGGGRGGEPKGEPGIKATRSIRTPKRGGVSGRKKGPGSSPPPQAGQRLCTPWVVCVEGEPLLGGLPSARDTPKLLQGATGGGEGNPGLLPPPKKRQGDSVCVCVFLDTCGIFSLPGGVVAEGGFPTFSGDPEPPGEGRWGGVSSGPAAAVGGAPPPRGRPEWGRGASAPASPAGPGPASRSSSFPCLSCAELPPPPPPPLQARLGFLFRGLEAAAAAAGPRWGAHGGGGGVGGLGRGAVRGVAGLVPGPGLRLRGQPLRLEEPPAQGPPRGDQAAVHQRPRRLPPLPLLHLGLERGDRSEAIADGFSSRMAKAAYRP
uniref:CAAX prenyl protease 2 isoform X3 n=1 Tax=Pogona vitticeps TaxID=103695 RepID=A0ABM5F526_9SAUR